MRQPWLDLQLQSDSETVLNYQKIPMDQPAVFLQYHSRLCCDCNSTPVVLWHDSHPSDCLLLNLADKWKLISHFLHVGHPNGLSSVQNLHLDRRCFHFLWDDLDFPD